MRSQRCDLRLLLTGHVASDHSLPSIWCRGRSFLRSSWQVCS